MATFPDTRGRFGQYGGRYVPETLMPALLELERAYDKARRDRGFQAEFKQYLKHYVGRPTPLYFAQRLTKKLGGAKIYLKREDLAHTGAHKINNAIGQALLARRMKKPRIIAETGAGQHGVATATVAAVFGLAMRNLHGHRRHATAGIECVSNAIAWAQRSRRSMPAAGRSRMRSAKPCVIGRPTCARTHYILGSVLGAHPYPMMIRDFQSVIGYEARKQILALRGDCRTISSPASAAEAMPSACFMRSSATSGSRWSAWRRAASVSKAGSMRRDFREGVPASCKAP